MDQILPSKHKPMPINEHISDQAVSGEAQAGAACPRWDRRELGRHESDDRLGTCLVVIGGVHGNEPAGLIAAQRVLDTLEREQPSGFHGRLVVLVGNLVALNASLDTGDPDVRYIDCDLNRIFTDEQIAKPADTSVEHGQMHELLASLRAQRAHCDRLIVMDLHTTSSDAPPVAVFEDSILARKFARQMPLPIYLGFEEELDGLVIDRVTSELDSVGIVVEGGQHTDPRSVDVHEAAIWAGLHAAGILRVDALTHEVSPGDLLRSAVGDQAYKVFDIRYRHAIAHADFEICPGIVAGGLIKQEITPIAIEDGLAITSPVRGRVFLPNMQSRKRIGDDGFFIVRHIDEGWLGFSARIRKQEWIHWVIAHLPGVYAMDDGLMYVDRDIAGVLKRQVFHIFGYRLIRHDQRDGGHGLKRVLNGISSFCMAFFRGPIPGGPDQHDPRFWIVRRHHLDS